MKLRNLIFLLVSLVASNLVAQQQILPIKSNAALKQFLLQHPNIDRSYGLKSVLSKTNAALDSLPFFDDFTSSNIVTDTLKWMDHNVFINNGFAINPPSYNVATFDGLDKDGNAYNLSTGSGYGPADTLTSVPRDFRVYSTKSGIHLSFFYQMCGYGTLPLSGDSLLLQFLTAGGKWNTVWSKAGGKAETMFTQIVIPVKDTIYIHGAFQFRFVNFANLSGNLNHWNVDYIYMHRGRSLTDTLYTDVAIMTMPTPILKRYYSMPWNQYKSNTILESSASTSFYVRNLKNTNVQVPSKYFTFNKQYSNLLTNQLFTLGSLTYQIPQKITYSFNTRIDTLTTKRDSVVVRSLYTASENSDVRRTNDSVYKDQLFANYYAYDDGTAEAGYGIAFGSGKVALGFETNTEDTLRAVDIYFNQSLATNSGINFSMTVWSTLGINGQQEKKLHYQTVLVPDHKYSYRDAMGGFTRFELDTPRFLPKGKFYIGWVQNSTYMLNIGFDMNYPDNFGTAFNPELYYMTTGSWQVSGFPGTLMMRPVVGLTKPVGIQKPNTSKANTLRVYPNPAHTLLYIELPTNSENHLTVMNMQGKLVIDQMLDGNVLNVETLSKGIYILNIFDPSKNTNYTTKFIIQ